MKYSQRVRVHVARPDGGDREAVVETALGRFRSRMLTKFLGNQYGVLLVMPRGMHVESVEIVESAKPPPV